MRSQRQIFPPLLSSVRASASVACLHEWRLFYLGRRDADEQLSAMPVPSPFSSLVFHENDSKFRLKNRTLKRPMFHWEAKCLARGDVFRQNDLSVSGRTDRRTEVDTHLEMENLIKFVMRPLCIGEKSGWKKRRGQR